MTFFKRQDIGRVYVIRMTLPDNTVVHKIGICHSNRATDRMMEILKSWFIKFRYVPYTELKMDREFGHPEELEEHIHKILAHKRYSPTYKVNGGTEMFTGIDEHRVIQFLKHCKDEEFHTPLELTDKQYFALGQYLAP